MLFVGPTADPTPHTCEHCRNLIIDPFRTISLTGQAGDELSQYAIAFPITLKGASEKPLSDCFFFQLVTRDRDAAADNWHLCILFAGNNQLEGFDRARFLWLPKNEWPSEEILCGNLDSWTDGKVSSWKDFKGNIDFWTPKEGTILRQTLDANTSTMDPWLDLVVEEGSAAANSIGTRPGRRDPSSPRSLLQAQNWLEKCRNCHDCLSLEPNIQYPSRLLCLNAEKGSVRLTELRDNMSPGSYCALSYCWGGEQEFKTTTSNIQSYKRMMSVEALPQTIQDAIRVARAMGFQFLWVDSLCIIQDNRTDMANELAKMADIYAGAGLTIAAATASSCHEGFLGRPESERPYWSLAFSLPFRCFNGQLDDIILRKLDDTIEDTCPLHQRAWAFQECVVSPRLLIYGATQMMWCCWAEIMSESCNGSADFHWLRHDILWPRRCLQPSSAGRTLQPDNSLMQTWNRLVEQYTTRRLTKLTDTLPAFSAIAHRFGEARHGVLASIKGNEPYLAGLWRDDFPLCLLWQNRSSGTRRGTIPQPLPSWSWTSSPDCRIYWKYFQRIDYIPSAKLLNAFVELGSPQALYGSVRDGQVTLTGRLKWLRIQTNPLSSRQASIEIEAHPSMVDHMDLDFSFDNRREVDSRWPGCYAWFLEVGRQKDRALNTNPKFTVAGLILEQRNSVEHFGRKAANVGCVDVGKDLPVFRRLGTFRFEIPKIGDRHMLVDESISWTHRLCTFIDTWEERSVILI